jgi:hypothetical protein
MTVEQIAGIAGIAIGLACVRWANSLADDEARERRRRAAAAERALPGRSGRMARRALGWGAEDDRASGTARLLYYRTFGLLVIAIGVAALLGAWS